MAKNRYSAMNQIGRAFLGGIAIGGVI